MDRPYPAWALRNARHLVVEAMQLLEASHSSLSFFDRRNEVMRAESGYKRAVIPRDESLAAHTISSSGPMVVLDTHEVRHPVLSGPDPNSPRLLKSPLTGLAVPKASFS